MKKINKNEIDRIEYNYENSKIKIFNKKNLLIYEKFASESFYGKVVKEFLKER